jgi:hypothetical protein
MIEELRMAPVKAAKSGVLLRAYAEPRTALSTAQSPSRVSDAHRDTAKFLRSSVDGYNRLQPASDSSFFRGSVALPNIPSITSPVRGAPSNAKFSVRI